MSTSKPNPESTDRGAPTKPAGGESGRDERTPDHPDVQADLHERADGANEETISDEANLRANPDPPE